MKEHKKRKSRRNWIIGFVCASPLIILLELLMFSEITLLLREASDFSVLVGTLVLIGFVGGNISLFLLIKYKTIKQ
jgi:hypothetical protein